MRIYPIDNFSCLAPVFMYIAPCILWRYIRSANFVIKWSRSISRADAGRYSTTKWLASSHLYYRWIELIFKVRPIMGFSSSLTVAAWKGKGHFHVNPPTLLQSVCLSLSYLYLFHPPFLVFSFHPVLRHAIRSKAFPWSQFKKQKKASVFDRTLWILTKFSV